MSIVDHLLELWRCELCGLNGQTRAGDPEGSCLEAHLRVCHSEDHR